MEQAFDILAEQFRPMLTTYLKALLRDQTLVEDVTQETLLAAYRSLEKFRKGENFGAWLRGIARNKVLENRRATMRRPLVVDSRVIEGMEDVYSMFDAPLPIGGAWNEKLEMIQACVEKLSGTLRDAVELVYRKGCSLRDAAQALNTTREAAGQRLSRARDLIRKCVALQVSGDSHV